MSTRTEIIDPQGDPKLLQDMQNIASKIAPARSDEVLSLDFSTAQADQALERVRMASVLRRSNSVLNIDMDSGPSITNPFRSNK